MGVAFEKTAAKNSINGTTGGAPAETIPATALSTSPPAAASSGMPSSAGQSISAPSGSGFSTSGAAATGTVSSAASNQNPNDAIVTRDLSSAGVVTVVSLLAAFAGVAI
jgi:pantoate kinase